MTVYDTLEKMFQKYLERKRVGMICILEKVRRVWVYDIFEI